MSEMEDEMRKALQDKCQDFISKFKAIGASDKEANMFAKGYLLGVTDGINAGQTLADSGIKVETAINLKKKNQEGERKEWLKK